MNAFWEHARRHAVEAGVDEDLFVIGAAYSVGGGIIAMVKQMTGEVQMGFVEDAIDSVEEVRPDVDGGISLN